MNRRAIACSAATAALLAGLAVPFLGAASAVDCATFADDEGDGALVKQAEQQTHDAHLDIVGVELGTRGGAVVGTVTLKDLATAHAEGGEEFTVSFNAGGKLMILSARRDAFGSPSARLLNNNDDTTGTATARFDAEQNTVTITAVMAEVDKALGAAAAGAEATGLKSSAAANIVNGTAHSVYDSAEAPEGTKHVIGTACGAPAVPVTVPEGYPKADCNTVGDIGGDGRQSNNANLPNDPDLDLTGVVLKADDTDVSAFVRLAGLSARPRTALGHAYEVAFSVKDKDAVERRFTFVTHAYENAQVASAEATMGGASVPGTTNPPTHLKYANAVQQSEITATYDTANSMVIFRVPRADLESLVPEFADGVEALKVTATAKTKAAPGVGASVADSTAANNGTEGTESWRIGDNACFGPPPSVLANAGLTTVQFSDAAAVAAKLTKTDGTALSGKTVEFAVGATKVTARTGSDGVARASLNPRLAAGSYQLVATFDGDATAEESTVTTPFTVVAEKTALTLTVTKSGTKRTVVAKLLDDDKHAVAGQAVAWYVNGKKVSTAKTTSAGTVTLKTAKPGQTVKATFTAVSGKYTGSTASKKV